jgi:hypothetical protein
MSFGTSDALERATARLNAAVEGLLLTHHEVRTLDWLTRWDHDTIESVASVIEKARQAGQNVP